MNLPQTNRLELWLTPKALHTLEDVALVAQYEAALPYSHLVVDDLLLPNILDILVASVKVAEATPVQSELYKFKLGKHLHETSNSLLQRFAAFFSSDEFLGALGRISGQSYADAVAHSAFFTKGDYIKAHDDVLPGRKGTFVLYLTDSDEKDGGMLELLDKDFAIAKRIIPKINRFLFFAPSDRSLHAVSTVKTEMVRYTLTAGVF